VRGEREAVEKAKVGKSESTKMEETMVKEMMTRERVEIEESQAAKAPRTTGKKEKLRNYRKASRCSSSFKGNQPTPVASVPSSQTLERLSTHLQPRMEKRRAIELSLI